MTSAGPGPQSPDAPQLPPHDLGDAGQRLFECLSLGLVVFDEQLKVLDHNPAAAFLVNGHASVADALAAGAVDARYQDWPQALADVLHRGRQQRFNQVVYRDADRGERLLDLLCVALTDQGGTHVTGGALVIEDVTSAVSMEKRLAVSERMAAVGKLAARVAHELNNPLDGILRYLNLALRAGEKGAADRVPDYLQQARSGLLRMAEIVRELVDFSRGTSTTFDDAGINTLVNEAVRVMSDKAVAAGVSVVCTLSDDLPAVAGTNLFQVFCNLIKNALDAMPDGGTLTIATAVADGEAVIRFEDTGIGLPDEMERIFEPFFTTKAPDKGTGLGLAICRDIIEKYNGRIVPGRREGGGTVFTVRLPLHGASAARTGPASPPARSQENDA